MNSFEDIKKLIEGGCIASSIINVIPHSLNRVSNFRLHEKPIDIEEFHAIYKGRMLHLTNIGSEHTGLKETLEALSDLEACSVRAAFFQKNEKYFCVLAELDALLNSVKIVGMFCWEHVKQA
ncbi:hypothetical protein [Saccharophagus degradans]|uniref:Uncharacterized protein n=1 Tax=Saccharophagus degradans TaxID=86304 RepID=A0AAW7X1K6_9GAMM|nr:hypothetical protein [Saccharophagus degradans]MDO6420848.1 hypothetical protein [Saccharophagus degradans]MDO6609801.1 hypothetical protein [Saccharophagus degradans]